MAEAFVQRLVAELAVEQNFKGEEDKVLLHYIFKRWMDGSLTEDGGTPQAPVQFTVAPADVSTVTVETGEESHPVADEIVINLSDTDNDSRDHSGDIYDGYCYVCDKGTRICNKCADFFSRAVPKPNNNDVVEEDYVVSKGTFLCFMCVTHHTVVIKDPRESKPVPHMYCPECVGNITKKT